MGWNNIKIKNECRLTKNLDNNTKFYFVHSYFASVKTNKIWKIYHQNMGLSLQ